MPSVACGNLAPYTQDSPCGGGGRMRRNCLDNRHKLLAKARRANLGRRFTGRGQLRPDPAALDEPLKRPLVIVKYRGIIMFLRCEWFCPARQLQYELV